MMIIVGKVKHIDKIVEELAKEGIKLQTEHSTDVPPDDFIKLFPNQKVVSRYCHTPRDEVDLNANLPSHRKCFIRKVKEVVQ